ncbi:MAG: extracellular solute-binding protein [Candidatus Wallbacteria bacterium]|nr:extracellular solute-binding protein [Candidatus Wallbacteria bacterium]
MNCPALSSVAAAAAILFSVVAATAVPAESRQEVVCYVTHDRPFSEPVLQRFERETGTAVRSVYDTEASKTVGLVNRLIAEKARPLCDVFWNNEPARMVMLAQKGLLEEWQPTAANGIPPTFRDPTHRFYCFGARVRVLIYNPKLVKPDQAPKSVLELAHPRWKGKACIANPLFGSTSTHVAALALRLGDVRLRGFLEAMVSNQVQIVASNSVVRDVVAAGTASIGLTDTDDALGAIRSDKDVAMVAPDQEAGGMGALMLPNTVALMAGGPHPQAARRLAEFLLSASVEQELAAGEAGQIPLRMGLAPPKWLGLERPPRAMEIDFNAVAGKIPVTAAMIKEVLLR